MLAAITSVAIGAPFAGLQSTMKDDQFWAIVEMARGSGGESEHAERLAERLKELSADQVLAFAIQFDTLVRAADSGPIWAAGVLLNAGHGSDDGFLYFRRWLIGQGRSTYFAALSDPDMLADAPVLWSDGRPSAEWESYGTDAADVYRAKTQRHLYEDVATRIPSSVPQYSDEWHWADFDDSYMLNSLPRLWARYGQHKVAADKQTRDYIREREEQAAKAEAYVGGLGTIKAGIVLVHRRFGSGTVVGVEPSHSGFHVTIRFQQGVELLQINSFTLHEFALASPSL
jgi:hypothetical protein